MTRSEFKTLQVEWYQKLSATGFRDIEQGYEYSSRLGGLWRGHTPESIQARYDHYAKARRFAHCYAFPNKRYQEVWMLYGEGYDFRRIAALLGYKDHTGVYEKFRRLKKTFLEWADEV